VPDSGSKVDWHKRHDAVRLKVRDNANTNKLASEIIQQYKSMRKLRIAKSQA